MTDDGFLGPARSYLGLSWGLLGQSWMLGTLPTSPWNFGKAAREPGRAGYNLRGGPAGETDRPGASACEGWLKFEGALTREMDQPSPDSSSVFTVYVYNIICSCSETLAWKTTSFFPAQHPMLRWTSERLCLCTRPAPSVVEEGLIAGAVNLPPTLGCQDLKAPTASVAEEGLIA